MSNEHVHPIFQPILESIAPEAEPKDEEPSDPDGECFRGGEWAAAQAAEMDCIRRNLK